MRTKSLPWSIKTYPASTKYDPNDRFPPIYHYNPNRNLVELNKRHSTHKKYYRASNKGIEYYITPLKSSYRKSHRKKDLPWTYSKNYITHNGLKTKLRPTSEIEAANALLSIRKRFSSRKYTRKY